MKILFLAFFTFVISSAFSQTSTAYFPIKKNESWCFYDTVEKTVNPNFYFDTIVFCSNDYKTVYVGVKSGQFEVLDQDLTKLHSGKLNRYFLNGDCIFLKDEFSWKCVSIKSSKVKTFEVDSIVQFEQLNYLYSKGKVGLITDDTEISPKYDAITIFRNPSRLEFEDGYFLVLNEGKFGLIKLNGQQVLPTVASQIIREDFEIIKFYEGNWKYLFPDGTIIDPKGAEIHFLNENCYKIYNTERTKSVLYKNHFPVSSTSKYDDFFKCNYSMKYLFKSNGRIGLLSENFKVKIAPNYEQLEELEDNRAYFKYFANGNWGLISENGIVLTPAIYQNILEVNSTKNGIHLTIAQDDLVGVVDINGKSILKCEFKNLIYINSGYYSLKGGKIGVNDLFGNEIYPCVFETCYIENYGLDANSDSLIGLERNGEYLFLTNELKPLNKPNCIDYQYFNNVLKCYYKDRIEVYFLEKNTVLDQHVYQQIQSVKIETKYDKSFYGIWTYPSSYLQLNEFEALYGAKFNLKSGISYPATFRKSKASVFTNWFEVGIFEDTNVHFALNNFPELIAVNAFQQLNCLNSVFPEQLILGGEFFDRFHLAPKLSSDFSFFTKGSTMNWLSNDLVSKTDKLVQSKGITYNKDIFQNVQLVYIGGTLEIVEKSEADMSLMDYFNYLNKADNLWFSEEVSSVVMNPFLGVKFSNNKIGIKRNLSNQGEYILELSEFKLNQQWQIASYREAGKNQLNLTLDIEKKDQTVFDILSYQISSDDDKEFVIIEKLSPVTKKSQKALFSTRLKPLTEFIYDDIIFAGELGFLVRNGENYFYLDSNGKPLKF